MDFTNSKFIIVGSGLFGAVLAERIAAVLNERVVVIEKREHIGGNCFSEVDAATGIEYHKYGTHIFHTSNKKVWDYIRGFTLFNDYRHQVYTTYMDKVYPMPVNLSTINSFYQLNLKPGEVDDFLRKEISNDGVTNPANFEELAINSIGKPLYEALIKGYSKKQWQKDPKELPLSIFKRLPFRKNYNSRYFHNKWEGIPLNGYATLFKNLLANKNIEVLLNTDFFEVRDQIPASATIIYSGAIDRFFDYQYGKLEWRTLDFQKEIMNVEDYQGTAVMNYAQDNILHTRIHEPRHLHPERDYIKSKTLVIKEFSKRDDGSNPYYPINDAANQQLLLQYKSEAAKQPNLIISGRLGEFAYYDMHETIARALEIFETGILCTLADNACSNNYYSPTGYLKT